MKNFLRKAAAAGLLVSAFIAGAHADPGAITGLTVYSVIVDNQNPAYSFFRIAPLCAFSSTQQGTQYCGTNFVFDAGSPQGKSILASLLSAKATGNKVSIVCNNCRLNNTAPAPDFGNWGVTVNQVILE